MKEDILVRRSRDLKNDAFFNELYPFNIKTLSARHWTPVHITRLVVEFLAGAGDKVLDIGCGAGKFCIASAYNNPETHFYGVEQRKYLVHHAQKAQRALGLKNVSFIHKNFTELDLREFDHFYYFNAFYENLDAEGKIDDQIECSEALYEYYIRYLHRQLSQMPEGTKIATYHSFHHEIPRSYQLIGTHANGDLNFWIKR